MLTLYASPESLYCAKLRILLRHKRIDWNEVMPDGGCGSETYRAMIPAGTMPAIDHDGLVLADSEAIAEYLEEIVPEPAMLPASAAARARCRERARFHDTRIEPELRRLFAWVSAKFRGHETVLTQVEILNQRLHEMARLLDADEFLDTSTLTLGDCGYPVTFAWLDRFIEVLELDIVWPKTVTGYRRAIVAHPAVTAELEAYEPAMRDWIASRPG